jgi:hypothetical protein
MHRITRASPTNSRLRIARPNPKPPRCIAPEPQESHFGGYFWKRFGEEVRRSHASLHRSERMLDCLSTLTHGLWICIKALLHGLE